MKGARRPLVATALFLSVLCALGLAVTRHAWHSDAALNSLFLKHRDEFETLLKMANEDVHLTRITPNFTWLDDDVAWPRKNVGISQERWGDYKRLFQRVGAEEILKPTAPPPRVMFPIVSEGIVPSSYSKGVVYSATPLNPVLKSLEE